MSPSKSEPGSAWISSQVQETGCSTSPSMPKAQLAVDRLGVASAVSTGQSRPASYWPGGSLGSRAAGRGTPW